MKKIFTTLILVIIGLCLFFSGQKVSATNKTIRVWVGAISEEKQLWMNWRLHLKKNWS